jgi:tRNA nucleotidyltransferase (CCA-adding enzyme)
MKKILDQVPGEVKAIAARVEKVVSITSNGDASAFLVGGAVIDLLQGREPKDWDIEVHGVSFAHLETLFEDLCPKLVGKCWGTMKLSAERCGGLDIDINVPRVDNKVGAGHKGFEAKLDPTLSPKEAARRRDFTINAVALNLSTGELVDPFGGLKDLAAGILRATDPKLFVQDPLRALRAMQLFARKMPDGTIDLETMRLILSMVPELAELPRERLKEEWGKLLGKAKNPSVGLTVMKDTGVIAAFPELEALIDCGQHPEWHPEGDVWVHSLHTVDSAAWVRDNGDLPEDWVEPFMFGTLLHDVGKPATTVFPHLVESGKFSKDLLWTARGHDLAGVAPGTSFLERLTNEKKLIERTTAIIREHMNPWNFHVNSAEEGAWRKQHGRLRLDVLGWMCRCDHCGGPAKNIGDPDLDHQISEMCWSRFSDIGPDPIPPILMGRHLIKAGLTPGEHFTKRLAAAFDAQMEDKSLGVDALLTVALSVQ